MQSVLLAQHKVTPFLWGSLKTDTPDSKCPQTNSRKKESGSLAGWSISSKIFLVLQVYLYLFMLKHLLPLWKSIMYDSVLISQRLWTRFMFQCFASLPSSCDKVLALCDEYKCECHEGMMKNPSRAILSLMVEICDVSAWHLHVTLAVCHLQNWTWCCRSESGFLSCHCSQQGPDKYRKWTLKNCPTRQPLVLTLGDTEGNECFSPPFPWKW